MGHTALCFQVCTMVMKMTWQLCRFVNWALLPLSRSPLTAVTAMAANFTDLHVCSTKLILSNNINNYHVSCAYSAFMHISGNVSGMSAAFMHSAFMYVIYSLGGIQSVSVVSHQKLKCKIWCSVARPDFHALLPQSSISAGNSPRGNAEDGPSSSSSSSGPNVLLVSR